MADTTASKIAILGGGSWGTTLSWLLASHGKNVTLWMRNSEKASHIRAKRQLTRPVNVRLPDKVCISTCLRECLQDAEMMLFCCTAQSLRDVASEVREVLTQKASNVPYLVSAAKGIELHTFKRMSEILRETMPGLPVCVISGPNLAAEILQNLPTATVIASENINTARFVQKQLFLPIFRTYSNTDVIGVEIGGALKNVIAIAAGVVDGLKLGGNAKAALLTRGLAEISRVAVALGGKAATLAGLAGMGDLLATCYSNYSRNYQFGKALSQGINPQEAEAQLQAVVEGITTTYAVCELSQKLKLELPIAEQVKAILGRQSTPSQAIMTLMTRPLVSE